jgi:hypothetical protein
MKYSIEFPNKVVLDRFETASGQEIPNYQEHSIMDFGDVQAQLSKYLGLYPGAKPRSLNATGIYNCHGFVFASGRTGIDHGRDVRMILHDDGYVKVDAAKAMSGDIVLYVAPDGDVPHSAVLVTTANESLTGFPVVVSKWGSFIEFVHDVPHCPYDSSNIEYWRLGRRPESRKKVTVSCAIQV